MKKDRLLGLLLVALFSIALNASVLAVPAPPYPIKVALPDGTDITVKMTGDEFFMYTTTIDGYNVLKQEDGYYHYAEDTGGKLASTGVRANDPGRRSAEEKAVLSRVLVGAPSWADAASKSSPLRLSNEEMSQFSNSPGQTAASWTGNYKTLVILVNFQDVQFKTPNPQQAFSDMLNQKDYSSNGSTGSVNQYYYENSAGRFNPTFDVVGPYTVSGPRSMYNWQSRNYGAMIAEAVRLADADVDFSLYADGMTAHAVYIFFAGEGNDTTSIWPHQSYINNVTVDGVMVSRYACSGEFENNRPNVPARIGTFCHEFGHITDWPDFYDTDYDDNGSSVAVGWYSLMDVGCYNNDSRTPPSSTAMERMLKGWMTPREFENSKQYTLKPVSEDEAYIIPTDNEGEYFLVEVRSGEDANGPNVWDEKLAAQLGLTEQMPIMMVYHVDRSQNMVSGRPAIDRWWPANDVNAFADHECFKVVRASKSSDRAWGYPGPSNVKTLSSGSNDEFWPWNRMGMVDEFQSIAADGNNIVVDYSNGIAPAKYINIVVVGDNHVEAEWSTFPHTGAFNVELFDAGGNNRLQQFETADKMAVVTMLQAETTYILKVAAKGDAGKFDEISFKTAASESVFPYLPLNGTYSVGESITLRLSGMTERISGAEWTLDGAAVGSYVITPSAGKHTISVRVVLSDGNEEIFTKTITVE